VTGKLKFFNTRVGYGFIVRDDGGPDCFVHISAAEAAGLQMTEGMRLEYDVIADERNGRNKATNLRAA
jgi:cold shock protein